MKFKKVILISLLILYSLPVCINANAIVIPKISKISNMENFIGNWEMKTIVTESSCPEIIIGSTTESELTIIKNSKKDLLFAHWDGGVWTSSNSILKPLSQMEALTERATELRFDDNNSWKAVLVDHLTLEEDNKMHSESLVKQYKNGILIGEYKTFSILTKIE